MEFRPPDDPPQQDGPADPLFAEALGRAIKVLRTGLDMGRRDLARAAGLSYSYLAEIENGKKGASAAAQQAIARALGISLSELLAAAEDWAEQIREDRAELAAPMVNLDAPSSSSSTPQAAPAAPRPRPRLVSVSEEGARARQKRWFHASAQPTKKAKRGAVPERLRALSSRSNLFKDAGGAARVLAELRRLVERMDPEDRERLLDMARRLAK
jgi:transcriptional regulator with XRE-family HTH domain